MKTNQPIETGQTNTLLTDGFKNELLTDKEAADLAKVSISTVKYWRQTGLLPFVKVGKHPRIWLSEFNRVFQKPDKMAIVGDGQRRNIHVLSE